MNDESQEMSYEGEVVFQIGTPGETSPAVGGSGMAVVATAPKWILKKLTARHRRVVQLKVAGLSREDIGKMASCTPEYVSMLLAQPLVKAYLAELHAELDQDLKDLMHPAISTVRDMMTSPDDKVALSAATTVLRANGKLGGQTDDGEKVTAEDIVSRLFEISNSTVNIQVNNN